MYHVLNAHKIGVSLKYFTTSVTRAGTNALHSLSPIAFGSTEDPCESESSMRELPLYSGIQSRIGS
jgi:hypothetical protein